VDEETLQDNAHRRVLRVGNTVHRPVHAWSSSVHSLLQYLESVDFPYSPRFLGIDEQGREVLTYIDGESGAAGWRKIHSQTGLAAFAHLLKEYHSAIAGYRPASASWSGVHEILKPGQIICHGDFGPWNVVWQDERPVGLLDWDYARPADLTFDIAYALEYVTPFRDDDFCTSWMHFPAAPERAERLRAFVTAYGADPSADWSAAVIKLQKEELNLVQRLANDGLEPQLTWVRDGYLDELKKHIQWSENNRHLVQ
jgi:thiamine kinase-like enzyme